MDITDEVKQLIGQPESEKLEYKAVLLPSRSMAQIISSFANTEGEYLILGASGSKNGKVEVNGLSEDFHANTITHKALDILVPQPKVSYQYIPFHGKNLYVIKTEKSDSPVAIEGKIYKRVGAAVKLTNPVEIIFKTNGYGRIESINQQLETYKSNATNAKIKISRLQKGSVKGFIAENDQIRNLRAFDENSQNDVEKILQIRHLYSHRNGIVDEKFLQYYAEQFNLNTEHQMPISEVCDKLCYLAEVAQRIDVVAAAKYQLAQMSN